MEVQMIGTGSMISSDNPACYLIDKKIMIDMPNGIVKELKKHNLFEQIEHIFITHMHGDHIFDLPFIFLDRLKSETPLTVYIAPSWYKKIKKLVKLAFPTKYYEIFFSKNIRFINNLTEINIDNINIASFKVNHGYMKPAYGYCVSYNDKTVVFSGDTCLCENLENQIKTSDFAVCECTLTKGNDKHMGVDNFSYLLNNYPNVKFIPSHMGINAKSQLQKLKYKNLKLKEDFSKFNL